MNVIHWEHTDNVNMSSLRGYVQTDYQHIVNVLGEPQQTNGDKVTVEWAVLATIEDEDGEEDVLFTVYDWKTGATPKGTWSWHIGGHSDRAVEVAEWFFGKTSTYAY